MRLISGEDLRLRLGLGEVDTFIVASEKALDEASFHIEADLRTPLTQTNYNDAWLLNANDFGRPSLKLKTTAGFLKSGTLEIGTGTTMASALTDTSLTDAAILNLDTGTIVLTDATLGLYVSARYTAGFPADAGDANLYDPTLTPQWLRQMGEVKAIALMGTLPEMKNKDGEIIDSKAFNRQYQSLMNARVRYTPGYQTPLP